MLITELFEFAVGPGVEDPILYVPPSLLGLVGRFVPGGLDLGNERVLGGLGALLGLRTLGLEVGLESLGVPEAVGRNDMVVPVFLNELLEVLPLGRGRIGDIMVGKPSLEFRLVPFVVGWRADVSAWSPKRPMLRMEPRKETAEEWSVGVGG